LAIEEKPEIAAQMREALACHLGALLCLGEDERALQNRLNEIADARRAPRRIRRIEPLCGFDVARQDGDVPRQDLVAGGADVG
jgi:hypothetical protein